YPVYGLAEATLAVSSGRRVDEPVLHRVGAAALAEDRVDSLGEAPAAGVALVACGPPACGTGVTIVDPATRRRCAADSVGEVWVQGPSVAQGYWGQPDLTAATF